VTGGFRFAELALFELLGRHAPSCAPDVAVSFVAGAALAHAWRAGQLAALLPVSPGLPGAAACTRSPSAAFDGAIGLITAHCEGPAGAERAAPAGDAHDTAELLDALLGPLYGELQAAYAARLATCAEASDQALARVLRRVSADLGQVRGEGRGLLTTLLAGRPSAPSPGASPLPAASAAAGLRAASSEAEASASSTLAGRSGLSGRVHELLAGEAAPLGVAVRAAFVTPGEATGGHAMPAAAIDTGGGGPG
jgi:hypothetical protein